MPELDLDRIREEHASVCGPCDGGLPMNCGCAPDSRQVVADLCAEVERLRSVAAVLEDATVEWARFDRQGDFYRQADGQGDVEFLRELCRDYGGDVRSRTVAPWRAS